MPRKKKEPKRVYVIGAGFSAGLGFPLTNDLLLKVWNRLNLRLRTQLTSIIKFHHPEFDPRRSTSFPELEPLLSALEVNRALFNHTREVAGKFKPRHIESASNNLLWNVAQWFDELHKELQKNIADSGWLGTFVDKIRAEKSTVISFNWDLVLDERLLERNTFAAQYGFSDKPDGPLLLKPHGSLNWFSGTQAERMKPDRVLRIAEEDGKSTWAFTRFRSPRSNWGRKYNPLIVAPHYMKRFDQPGFQRIWNACVSELSTASEVVFIGYSQPPSDFHAKFMLRCAFHNAVDGKIIESEKRGAPSGPPAVLVVNPDQASAKRIESITTPAAAFKWFPLTAREWVNGGM